MKICFVLVEPAVPENIGAAARAIKTMGFEELRLVKPSNHLADEAKWLAHGSVEILEQAKVYNSFRESIADLNFIIGTTAKVRTAKHDYYTPEKASELVKKKESTISDVGLVFGREESGLTNVELSLCDIASTVPLAKPYPSINLAQSVMLYAYIFSSLNEELVHDDDLSKKNSRMYHELKENASEILKLLNIENDSMLYHRILERIAGSSEDDVRLFLSFAKKLHRKFE